MKLQKDSGTVLEELQVSPLIIVTVINENIKKTSSGYRANISIYFVIQKCSKQVQVLRSISTLQMKSVDGAHGIFPDAGNLIWTQKTKVVVPYNFQHFPFPRT